MTSAISNKFDRVLLSASGNLETFYEKIPKGFNSLMLSGFVDQALYDPIDLTITVTFSNTTSEDHHVDTYTWSPHRFHKRLHIKAPYFKVKVTNNDGVNDVTVTLYSLFSAGDLDDESHAILQGTLKVQEYESRNLGSHENLAADVTINFGASSTPAFDITHMSIGTLHYSDSSTGSTDGISVDGSANGGTNYYRLMTFNPVVVGSTRQHTILGLSLHGLNSLKLTNISGGTNYDNVKATIVGTP